MTYLQALGWLVGGWSAYKLYESVAKPKGKVEFGELELVGVDIVENLDFEKYKDERLQINGFDAGSNLFIEKKVFEKALSLVKSGKMKTNHMAAILANIMIECHYNEVLDEEPSRKWWNENYFGDLKYTPRNYFGYRYGNSSKSRNGGKKGKEIGNKSFEDGYTFRGRGLCQLTGRFLYEKFSKVNGVDAVSNPDLARDFDMNFNYMVCAFMHWKGALFNGYNLNRVMPENSLEFSKSRMILNYGEYVSKKNKNHLINSNGMAFYKLLNKFLEDDTARKKKN
ncbi:hypothetical protein ACQ1PL_07990 [Ornithobacterium rhinotracheale]